MHDATPSRRLRQVRRALVAGARMLALAVVLVWSAFPIALLVLGSLRMPRDIFSEKNLFVFTPTLQNYVNLWQRWPDVNFAHLLNDETVGRVRIEATELDLRAASRITGVDWPIGGTLTGSLNADGPLGALKFSGSMQLARGIIPLDWNGSAVR